MFGARLAPLPIEAALIWKRRQHQIKKADRCQIVHAIGNKGSALYRGEMKKPGNNCSWPAKQSQEQKASSRNEGVPNDRKNAFFAQTETSATRDDPAETRYQRAFQRNYCFGKISTD